jgi:NAD(P)H-flavin reductase
MFRILTAVATMVSSATPWWMGVPTKLIKKTTLVEEEAPHRLPVYTLTFSIPKDAIISSDRTKPHTEVDMGLGDVIKMVIPGYKPKSYSMSALRETEFDITVKVYPNGRASGFLDRLQVGDTMGTFGMSASRRRNPGDFVGIIAYGVGITEGLPVTAAELANGNADKVILLWASRTMADTFWHDKIELLKIQYPNKFEMVYLLSREERKDCLYGHVTPQLLNQVFQPENRSGARFLSVGTKEMMRMTDVMLEEINYPMSQHALLPKV